MGVINQLDISIANLIAAGEVVDRPASVIKELMENSIDAGATDITVEIKNGGISFMRVTDNGVGMSREDALLCLSRHATSKIKNASDLDAIMTLGFRGEALAAISSVARVRIMTKQKSDSTGTLVECEHSKKPVASETGCKNGTTVIVEELFANVPARRKFLKNDRSEGMAVAAVVEKIALSRPDISIKLIADNNQKMVTAGDKKLYNTVYSLFGRDFAKKIIQVDFVSDGIRVNGYIGQPDNVRVNRNFENFFINGRYIKSKTASAALEQAFSSYLQSEKFPCCILFIDIHPAFVDVNVHPTKLEVKFSNERAVFDAVYCAVKNALINNTSYTATLFEKQSIPDNALKTYNTFTPVYDRFDSGKKAEQVSIVDPSDNRTTDKNTDKKAIDITPFDEISTISPNPSDYISPKNISTGGNALGGSVFNKKNTTALPSDRENENGGKKESLLPSKFSTYKPTVTSTVNSNDKIGYDKPNDFDGGVGLKSSEEKIQAERDVTVGGLHSSECTVTENIPSTVTAKPIYKYLGVVFNTYILVEYENKMLMIDKHAAHERILFEKMRKNREATRDKYQQVCLIPTRLTLSREEYGACESYREDIKATGFEFELDPISSCVSITVIPGGIDNNLANELFIEIAGALASGTGNAGVAKNIYFEKALYQASCKAAVKGGRQDGEHDMKYIVETLLSDPSIRYCPHGRPVMFEVSQGAIESKFKRT